MNVIRLEYGIPIEGWDGSKCHERNAVEVLKSEFESTMRMLGNANNQENRDKSDAALNAYMKAENEWLAKRRTVVMTFEFKSPLFQTVIVERTMWEDSYHYEIVDAIREAIGVTLSIKING
jgi:hypothetical protein